MQKQTCFNKKIQSNLKWKKNYHHPTFVQYKKSPINIYLAAQPDPRLVGVVESWTQ